MKKILLITIIEVLIVMSAIANTLQMKGFIPGNIDKQNMTQEPGNFMSYYKQTEKTMNTRNGPKTYYDIDSTGVMPTKSFDLEKESENPIKPTIKRDFNPSNFAKDDRPRLKVAGHISAFRLPQKVK